MPDPQFVKPELDQLISLIDIVLGSINPNAGVYLNRNTVDAAYAGYIFSLVLRGVERIVDPTSPNAIRLRSAQGSSTSAPSVFIVRGSPGALTAANQDFGYAVFDYEDSSFEVHLGVQYQGSSGVLHEFDISIIPSEDAEECRQSGKQPTSGKPHAVFECKCYEKNLGIELGREFVGLKSDFTSIPMARLVTNSYSGSVARFLRKNNRPKASFRLDPSNPNMEQEFIMAVADELRNTL
jgi:hypothetical protein